MSPLTPKRRCLTALFGLAAILVMLGADGDQTRFTKLGHEMKCMCGDCNYILLECNHVGCPSSSKMLAQLHDGINRGDSDSAIQQSFVQEYGLVVWASPINRGFGRVAWITPFAASLLGLLLIVLLARKWKRQNLAVERGGAFSASEQLSGYREQARRETEL